MHSPPRSEQTRQRMIQERRARYGQSELVSSDLGRPLLNQVIIEGIVASYDKTRFTAAGEPVVKLQLHHLSEQSLGHQSQGRSRHREVRCDLSVLVIGHEMAESVAGLIQAGVITSQVLRITGFLTRNAYKDELSWVILEATAIEVLPPVAE